ncbi:MAG: helix-turn-helix transcriptional regulator [Bacteroidales bacterium]|nr:helix-turn-helix transcriptional regulator [Bacteroidales bacterium]
MIKRSSQKSTALSLHDYSDDISEFGAKVRYNREKEGLSLDDMANMIGTDKSALSRIENGERNPKLDTLLKIADSLHITPADLIPERFHNHNTETLLPSVYGKLLKLPSQRQAEAIEYIIAMLDGLLLRYQ